MGQGTAHLRAPPAFPAFLSPPSLSGGAVGRGGGRADRPPGEQNAAWGGVRLRYATQPPASVLCPFKRRSPHPASTVRDGTTGDSRGGGGVSSRIQNSDFRFQISGFRVQNCGAACAVFDVDIGDGVPARKLPYNRGRNHPPPPPLSCCHGYSRVCPRVAQRTRTTWRMSGWWARICRRATGSRWCTSSSRTRGRPLGGWRGWHGIPTREVGGLLRLGVHGRLEIGEKVV